MLYTFFHFLYFLNKFLELFYTFLQLLPAQKKFVCNILPIVLEKYGQHVGQMWAIASHMRSLDGPYVGSAPKPNTTHSVARTVAINGRAWSNTFENQRPYMGLITEHFLRTIACISA